MIAVFVVTVLGLLDSYYIALERAYRDLYATESAKGGRDMLVANGTEGRP